MRPQWDTPLRYLVLVFLLILVIATLWYVREIFQPLITAALIAYFLSPAVGFGVSPRTCRPPTSYVGCGQGTRALAGGGHGLHVVRGGLGPGREGLVADDGRDAARDRAQGQGPARAGDLGHGADDR